MGDVVKEPIRKGCYSPRVREEVSDDQVVQSWNTAEIVIRCAKLLSGTRDFDFAMNQVLLEISKVVRLDRVMIMGTDRVTAKVLYEWTAVDVPVERILCRILTILR